MDEPQVGSPRRWFRYSMRTFLVVLTLLCIWLGSLVNSARRQKESVAAIRSVGGSVLYDFQVLGGSFNHAAISPVPKWLQGWVGLDLVSDVGLVYLKNAPRRETNRQVIEEMMKHVAGFPHLTCLVLYGSQATDENLEAIGKLKDLEYLFIFGPTDVSDRGVQQLTSLNKLEMLHLSQSRITDKSVRLLAQLHQLRYLELPGNDLTDVGLAELKHMPQLQLLRLGGPGQNRVTAKGLKSLEELPRLQWLEAGGAPMRWLNRPQVNPVGRQNVIADESVREAE